MTRTSLHAVLLAAFSILPVLPAMADGTAPCSLDQMQVNPQSVIAPCSALLDGHDIKDDARADTFFVRGRAYARTGRVKAAAQDYDVAVKLDPSRSDILVSRASAEYKLGLRDESWADLERALTINPKEARAYRAMGQAFQSAGQIDEAISLYSRALEVDPSEPYALLLRSERYAQRNMWKLAMADADALAAIPPAVINKLGYVDERGMLKDFHVVALDHRARLHEQLGDHAAAEKDLDAALDWKRSADTLNTRAEFLIEQQRSDEASKDLDEAAALDPTSGDIQFDRGMALTQKDKFAEGLEAFSKAYELHAKASVDADQIGGDLMMKARMLRGLGRTDDASEQIEQAVWISPDIRAVTVNALRARGYWSDANVPALPSPAFSGALRACMIDKDCN